jgi:hypothetical protein
MKQGEAVVTGLMEITVTTRGADTVIPGKAPAMKAAAYMATGRAGTGAMMPGTAAARGPAAIFGVMRGEDTMTGPGGTPAIPQAEDTMTAAAAIPEVKAVVCMATGRA